MPPTSRARQARTARQRVSEPRVGNAPRVYAVLLILLALLAVLIPIAGLLAAVLESPKPEFTGLTPHPLTLSNAELDEWSSLRTVEPEGEETFVGLVLLVKGLNPAEGTLEGTLRVSLIDTSSSLHLMYKNTENGRATPVATYNDRSGLLLKREYQNLTVTLRAESFEAAIPLARLYGSEDVGGSEMYFDVSFPIHGEPNRYPFDWYLPYTGPTIDLGPRLTYVSADGQTAPRLPSRLGVAAMPAVSGRSDTVIEFLDKYDLRGKSSKDMTVEDVEDLSPYLAVRYGADSVALFVQRPARTRAFVLAMALAPLLLFLVLVGRLVRRWRQGQLHGSPPTELPVELAAAFLAILSLRQVLVPNEVQGLTAVDFILGAQLAAFIGLVVVQYALGLLSSPDDVQG